MSDVMPQNDLLLSRGTSRTLDGYVVDACVDRSGTIAAFALADGTVHLTSVESDQDWRDVRAHDDGLLALSPDAVAGSFLTGGEEGLFQRVRAQGPCEAIADFKGKWVEQVVSHPDPKSGVIACGVGRNVHVFDTNGRALKTLEHPSTVTGLVFDAKGKRIAASHYNGVSLWFVASKTDNPRRLEWKGSHTGVVMAPAGDVVVSTMQENALHGWRLSDSQHMRMSGYPAKVESMAFTQSGKWLASSGADTIVMWPFFAGGPMGKPPMEMAGGLGVMCTRIACHPRMEMVAAGFADGSVVLVDLPTERVLPLVGPVGQDKISALSWSPDGAFLLFGTQEGRATIVDLSVRNA